MTEQATLVIPLEQFTPGQTRMYLETRVTGRGGGTRYVSYAVDLELPRDEARRALFACIDRMERELGATL